MFYEIKELLFHPDVFFTEKVGEEVDLVFPALIIFIGGIIGLVTPIGISAFIPGHSRNIIIMPDAVVVGLGLAFITWILISGIFYGVCRLFSGTGTFYAALQNAAMALFP
jgi:hypothetical protein